MNKLLLRLSAVVLSLGMLGAAACSGCSQQLTGSSSTVPAVSDLGYICGRDTHKVGNACVADRLSTSTNTLSTTSTTGNK